MTAPGRPALFDVRPGEGRRLLTLGGAMAAILAAHTIAETARDAMFLRTVPSSYLSIVYVALAGLALLVLRGNSALIRRVGRRHALVSTLMVASYGTAMFYLLGADTIAAFGLYLWSGLLGTIVVVQFWLLAGSMFTSTEAKRLFGLVAAMGAIGAFLGATFAAGLLYVISVEQLLPVASGFYLLGGMLLTGEADEPVALAPRRQRPGTVSGPVRLRDQPYAARLAAISVLATAAALVSDYLLKTTAVVELGKEALPGFFARYNGAVSMLSLVLQLVGASWLLRRLGVLGAVTLLPVSLIVGGTATILTASLFAVIVVTKGADATLRHSVNRVSGELLWMPVGSDVRAAIREPLESVVSRVVQAVTAALLLGISVLGLATPSVVAGILVGLALLWFGVAASLRTRYLSQLRTALMRPAFDTEQDLDVESLELVVEALSSVEDRRVIAAIKVLQRHHRSRLIPALLLRHDSPEVLAIALDAIAMPGRTDWIPLTRRLLNGEHPVVRIAAMRALARVGDRTAIEKGLRDPDPVVRASAAFWEAHTSPATDLLAEPTVIRMLSDDDADAETIKRILIEAIRDDGDARWAPVLLELARTSDPAMIEPLAHAIERVPDPRFLPILVERLGTRAGRSNVRAALIAIGEPAIDAVEAALRDAATPPRVRLHLPTTLALFGSQRAGDILLAQLASERSGAVRYRLLRAIARLALHNDVRFDKKTLLTELEHHLKEHFRLLGLAVAFEGTAPTRPSRRANRESRALLKPNRDSQAAVGPNGPRAVADSGVHPPSERTDPWKAAGSDSGVNHPRPVEDLPAAIAAVSLGALPNTPSPRSAAATPPSGSRSAISIPSARVIESAELVRGLLRDKISQARDRVFLCLEALHPRDDVRSIERAFEGQDRAARAHALEFLDTLTRAPIYDDAEKLRTAILVAYEDLTPTQQIERVPALADTPPNAREALDRMLRDSDSLLAACTAYHALQLGPSDLTERVLEIAQAHPLLAQLQLGVAGA